MFRRPYFQAIPHHRWRPSSRGWVHCRRWDGLCKALQISGPHGLSDRVPAPTCGYTFGELEGSSDQSRIHGWMQWVTSNFPNICGCIRHSRVAGRELVIQQISVCLVKNMTDNDQNRYFQYSQFYRYLNLEQVNSIYYIYYSWANALLDGTHLIPTQSMFATGHGASQSWRLILCLSAWRYKPSVGVICSNSDCSANSSGIELGFEAPGPGGARFSPPSPIAAAQKTCPEPGPCKGCATVSRRCWHRAPGRMQCSSEWVRQANKQQLAPYDRSARRERHCQIWAIWGYSLFPLPLSPDLSFQISL